MSETPASTLRRAAEKVRDIASRSSGGPWEATGGIGDFGWSVMFPGLHGNGVEAEDSPAGKADAEWIGMLGPQIAESLAAWLEREAKSANRRHPTDQNPAVDFARLLLGEEAS